MYYLDQVWIKQVSNKMRLILWDLAPQVGKILSVNYHALIKMENNGCISEKGF